MPNEPRPLREALREAVDQMRTAAWEYGLSDDSGGSKSFEEALANFRAADARVDALIAQIPAEAKVNDVE